MNCANCDWTGEFSEAVDHYRWTRHQLVSKGQPQDLTGFIGTCQSCGCDLAVYPSQAPGGLGPERRLCDRCVFARPA